MFPIMANFVLKLEGPTYQEFSFKTIKGITEVIDTSW